MTHYKSRYPDLFYVDSTASPDEIQTEICEDGMHDKAGAAEYSAKQFPMSTGPHGWKNRPRSPGLNWYKDYDTPEKLRAGRVLVVEYVKQGRQ